MFLVIFVSLIKLIWEINNKEILFTVDIVEGFELIKC